MSHIQTRPIHPLLLFIFCPWHSLVFTTFESVLFLTKTICTNLKAPLIFSPVTTNAFWWNESRRKSVNHTSYLEKHLCIKRLKHWSIFHNLNFTVFNNDPNTPSDKNSDGFTLSLMQISLPLHNYYCFFSPNTFPREEERMNILMVCLTGCINVTKYNLRITES